MSCAFRNVFRLQKQKLCATSWKSLYNAPPLHRRGLASPLLTCRRCMSENPLHKRTFHEKGYILLVIPAITFGLGVWQTQRRKWKLGLIKDLEERTQAEAIPFPAHLEDLEDLEYKKVVIKGKFDHSREIYIAPRSKIDPTDSHGNAGGGLISSSNSTGAHVVTPFTLSNQDLTILVNRGWVPRKNMNPSTRQAGQIEGDIVLVAVVRKTEKRQPFGAKDDPARNHWCNRNVDAMAEYLGTAPVFLDAYDSVPGGPIGRQTRVTLRNEHLTYMFTWFSLSALTTILWFKQYYKR